MVRLAIVDPVRLLLNVPANRRIWNPIAMKEPHMTARAFACLMMGALLVAGAGCSKAESTAQATETTGSAKAAQAVGGVGVVDLDSLAKQLGRDQEMGKAVQDRLAALNEKLAKLKDSLERLMDEKRTSFGGEPSDDQQKQLISMQERMDAQLLESKRKAEVELAGYKQALIDQFREQTKPILRDVATARGLSIVVPKNNGLLLTIDPAVELTDEVAKRILAVRGSSAGKKAAAIDEDADGDLGTETSLR
jgi:Skp family chaperone for outer membrane proteins